MTPSRQNTVACPEADEGSSAYPSAPGTAPPVGVRVLRTLKEYGDQPVYRGVSYCDAVRRAGAGEVLQVLPNSIQVCGWAPVVLGLKEPEGRFEEGLAPRLAFPVAGLLLAPLDRFPGEPDAVIVRARPEVLGAMVAALDRERLWEGDRRSGLDRTAVPYIAQLPPAAPRAGGPERGPASARRWLVGGVNRGLAALAGSQRWQDLTHRLFRSRLVTAGFEALISRTLADMSVCRNSTVIPLLSGQVNVSFFCTGGITWGRNHPQYLTSGWPWPLFQQASQGEGR